MSDIKLNSLNKKITSYIEILFLAASATLKNDSIQGERHRKYHALLENTLTDLGFRVSSSSNLTIMLSKPEQQYIYGIHSHSWFNGKEIFTSALSEYHGLPYLGPPPTIRAVSEDKKLFKLLAKAVGIPVLPEYSLKQFILEFDQLSQSGTKSFILKPRNGIASQYIYYIEHLDQLSSILPILPQNLLHNDMLIIEPYVDGINISVPIIEGININALPIYEEFDDNPQNIITFEGKRRISNGYHRKVYNGELVFLLKKYACLIEKEIRPYDYGRFDFRCDVKSGIPYLIDANLICNLSKGSVVATAAKDIGVEYKDLIGHILSTSITRQLQKLDKI